MGKSEQPPNAHEQYEIKLAQIHKEQYIQAYIQQKQITQQKGTLVQKSTKEKKQAKFIHISIFTFKP